MAEVRTPPSNEPEDSARLLAPILRTPYVIGIRDTVRQVRFDSYDMLPNGTNRDRGMFAVPLMGQSFRYALPDWEVNLEDRRTDFIPPDFLKPSFDRLIYWTGFKTKLGIRTTSKKGRKSYFRIGQPFPDDEDTGQVTLFEDDDFITVSVEDDLSVEDGLPARKVLTVISRVREEVVNGESVVMLRSWLAVPRRFLSNTLFECADEEQIDAIPLARIPFERMPEYREKEDGNTGENKSG